MKTVIIGSGNVAYHLAKAFLQKGISVSQIYGRNESELKKISEELDIPYSSQKIQQADFYLICVKDDAIAEVSKAIPSQDCLVAHSSGAVSRETLVGNYRKAVLYPLQTFSKNKALNYSEIPFFIDAENAEDENLLRNLAEKISTRVAFADGEKRKHIHLTAVFACNFTNHLFARAKEIADSQNIPFQFFLPLIDETTRKIHEMDPKMAQTGPAVRNDKAVLKAHEELLADPEKIKLYKTLNESIKKMYEL